MDSHIDKKKYHSSFLFYDIYEHENYFTIDGVKGGFANAKDCREYIAFIAPPRDKQLKIQLQYWSSN